MFELLLSPTVKTVNIQSIRPFFRQPFAAMLKQLGNGLKDLVLEDSSWLQGRDCLPSALARMTGLQRISLRYLANDLMVQSITHSFQRFQSLNVLLFCFVLQVATLARNCRHLQASSDLLLTLHNDEETTHLVMQTHLKGNGREQLV